LIDPYDNMNPRLPHKSHEDAGDVAPSDAVRGPSRRGAAKKRKQRTSSTLLKMGLPKRPLSAYNIFFAAERIRIYEEKSSENSNSGGSGSEKRVSFEELGKIIGRRWRELPDTGRKVYDSQAEKEVERYREERRVYEEARRQRIRGVVGSTCAAGAAVAGVDDRSSALKPPPTASMSRSSTCHGLPPYLQDYRAGAGIILNEHRDKGDQYTFHSGAAQKHTQQEPSDPLLSGFAEKRGSDIRDDGTGGSREQQYVDYSRELYHQHSSASLSRGDMGADDQHHPQASHNLDPQHELMYYANRRQDASSLAGSGCNAPHQLPHHPPARPGLSTGAAAGTVDGNHHVSSTAGRHGSVAMGLPSGTEVTALDANGRPVTYKVQYASYRMTRREADQYMHQLGDYLARNKVPSSSTFGFYPGNGHHSSHPQPRYGQEQGPTMSGGGRSEPPHGYSAPLYREPLQQDYNHHPFPPSHSFHDSSAAAAREEASARGAADQGR
jgi:hypothetical protein